MKIRQGFVSNSSSSSFLLVTTMENHNRALEQFKPDEIKIIDFIMREKKNAFGRDLILGEKYSCDGGSTVGDLIENYPELVYDDIYVVWEKYEKILNENKDEVFSYNVDL